MSLENITEEEIRKAFNESAEDLEKAVLNLCRNHKILKEESENLQKQNDEITQVADTVAKNCLELTQVVKDLHIWLGSVRDKFKAPDKDYTSYMDIMDSLAVFVSGSGAIKAGVIKHAQESENAGNN